MGELISLLVAIVWTSTALFADGATKIVGPSVLNVWRMLLTIPLLGIMLWLMSGVVWPENFSIGAWLWLLASGFMGFVFGDFCLFNAYKIIGSKFGQLFMVLASPFAALSAFMIMGESLGLKALVGMIVTILGIGMSILGKSDSEVSSRLVEFRLPLRGILLGIGAGLGQGVGLVLSKQGMLLIPENNSMTGLSALLLIPMSATMIRAIMGLIGFTITMIARGQSHNFMLPWKTAKAATLTLGSVITGPFIGVSLSLLAVSITPSGIAQTLMSLTPIFIIWPSKWFFHTKVRFMEVLGAIIAVTGAALFFI